MMRARGLAGATLGELSSRLGRKVPVDFKRAKGFSGQLLEQALGADSASRAEPDFAALGVELKTLPVDRQGRPRESTFVCTIPLTEIGDVEWASSRVRRKLRRVLWIPIEAEPAVVIESRRIGVPLLWSLEPEDELALRVDWEELAGLIGRGELESITGHMGRFLQIRPKAANSRSRRHGLDEDGAIYAALPRGFYLRAAFTRRILERHYVLPRAP
jgi:DNA mismatch repair protein MutH